MVSGGNRGLQLIGAYGFEIEKQKLSGKIQNVAHCTCELKILQGTNQRGNQ